MCALSTLVYKICSEKNISCRTNEKGSVIQTDKCFYHKKVVTTKVLLFPLTRSSCAYDITSYQTVFIVGPPNVADFHLLLPRECEKNDTHRQREKEEPFFSGTEPKEKEEVLSTAC